MKDKGFQLNWISKYRDELYGIAILTVLFFHFAMMHTNAYEGSNQLTYKLTKAFYDYFGSGGVDIFVFMSGMGLYYSFSKNSDIGRFYGRRFRRILIPYLIVGGIFWGRVDLFYRAEGFARFLKDFFYVTFVTEGVNNLWFISFIGVMYLIFPFIYKASFDNRFGKIIYLLILIAAILLPYYLQIHHHDLYKNLDKALVRIPVFVIGIMAGKAIKEKKTIPHLVAILIAVFGIYFGYYAAINGIKDVPKRYSTSLLALGVLIICVYILRSIDRAKIIRKILCFFGKYSLELYLLHILMWELMGEAGIPLHRASRYAILVGASCLLAPILSKLTSVISRALAGEDKRIQHISNGQ